MPANRYVHGAWNVICDSCGFKKKSFEVRKRWDGLIVCADTCWETDHPQKFLRVNEESMVPSFVRPEPEPTYIDICWLYDRAAYADLGTADCMMADLATPSYSLLFHMKNDSGAP